MGRMHAAASQEMFCEDEQMQTLNAPFKSKMHSSLSQNQFTGPRVSLLPLRFFPRRALCKTEISFVKYMFSFLFLGPVRHEGFYFSSSVSLC